MRIPTMVVSGIAVILGCAGPGLEGPRSVQDLDGYALNSCGPADGPAVELYLTASPPPREGAIAWTDSVGLVRATPADSAAATVAGDDVLRVLVWVGADRLAGRRFTLSGEQPDWGNVAFCGPDGCVSASEGHVQFTAATADELAGDYELRTTDGEVRAGSFEAPMVQRQFLCG